MNISSVEELQDYLCGFGVPIDEWGQGKAKTVEDLFSEIRDGEAILSEEEGQPIRQINVVGVNVYSSFGGIRRHLREKEQRFADGRTRVRKLDASMGEKMLPGETWEQACGRAIREELKQPGAAQFTNYRFAPKTGSMGSYPGLTTVYNLHIADYEMPDDLFCPDYEIPDGNKTLIFDWEAV